MAEGAATVHTALQGYRARSTGDKYLNSGGTRYPDFLGDTKDQRSYLHWSALWMGLCAERLADGGLMIVFSDWRQLPVTTDAMQAAGVTWRGVAVWDKTGGARPYKGGFRSQADTSSGEQWGAAGRDLLAWGVPSQSAGRWQAAPSGQASALDGGYCRRLRA